MKKIWSLIAVAAFSVTAAFAQNTKQMEIDNGILKKYFAEHNLKPIKTASGLYYTVDKKGTGANPKVGQTVYVNYVGHTLDGKKFDASREPYAFALGRHSVIEGWDEGIALLNKGEKATLYIPSHLGYGASGSGPIAPNAVLAFEVELVDIK